MRSMSWSQATDILQCPKMWHHKYVARDVPFAVNEALAMGSMIHSAAEQFFMSGLANQNVVVNKRLRLASQWAWDNRPINAIDWTDQHRRKLSLAMYSMEEIFKFKKLRVPSCMNLERKMRMDYSKNWQLVGVADMISLEGKKLILSDFKTGKLKQRLNAPVEQVALYAFMWDAIEGNRPIDVVSIIYLGVPWKRYKWDEFEFIKKQATAKIDMAISNAQAIMDGGEVEAKTSALCGWCPALGKCEPGVEFVTKRIAQGKSASENAVELMSQFQKEEK